MKRQIGLWIDHREAVIVGVYEEGGATTKIESNVEKPIRPHGSAHSKAGYQPEDHRNKQLADHLNKYYDRVISLIRDAESILIFGHGEAKDELKKRMESEKLHVRIVGIEAVDRMTERQIVARVREHSHRQNTPMDSA